MQQEEQRTGGWTDRKSGEQKDGQTDIQDRETHRKRQTYKQEVRQTYKQTDRQKYKETDKQAFKQTDGQKQNS